MASDPSDRTLEGTGPIDLPDVQFPTGMNAAEQNAAWQGAMQERGGLTPTEQITALPGGSNPPPGWELDRTYTPPGSSQEYDIYTRDVGRGTDLRVGGPTEITINGPGDTTPGPDGPPGAEGPAGPAGSGSGDGVPGEGPIQGTDEKFPDDEVGGTTKECPPEATPLEEFGRGLIDGVKMAVAAAVVVAGVVALFGSGPIVAGLLAGAAIVGAFMLGYEVGTLIFNPPKDLNEVARRWGGVIGGLAPIGRLARAFRGLFRPPVEVLPAPPKPQLPPPKPKPDIELEYNPQTGVFEPVPIKPGGTAPPTGNNLPAPRPVGNPAGPRPGSGQPPVLPPSTTPPASTGSGALNPTGVKGGKPDGNPTPVRQGENARSDIRENESADILADKGYKVDRNPGKRPDNEHKPDYKIEGEYADNIAPEPNTSPRNIADRIGKKAGTGQADRVVLNLDDSLASPDDIQRALNAAYKTPGNGAQELKEVIVIKDGTVTSWTPPFE